VEKSEKFRPTKNNPSAEFAHCGLEVGGAPLRMEGNTSSSHGSGTSATRRSERRDRRDRERRRKGAEKSDEAFGGDDVAVRSDERAPNLCA